MDMTGHPRRPVWGLWGILTLALAAILVSLRATEVLPLSYANRVGPLSLAASLPIALLTSAGLTLPLTIWLTHIGHWRAILRPTPGKAALALGLSLLVPGLITASGQPYMIGPLYLFLAVAHPNATTLTGVIVYFALALPLLYPASAALIWGLKRKTRPVAMMGLPVGFYGLLYLLGGTF